MGDVVQLRAKRQRISKRLDTNATDKGPGSVSSLIEHKHHETIAVLRSALRKALRGEVSGVAICVLGTEGDAQCVTGEFRDATPLAYSVVQRLAWKMNVLADGGFDD